MNLLYCWTSCFWCNIKRETEVVFFGFWFFRLIAFFLCHMYSLLSLTCIYYCNILFWGYIMAKAHLQSFQVPLSSCLYLFSQGLQNIAVVQKNDFFLNYFFCCILHILLIWCWLSLSICNYWLVVCIYSVVRGFYYALQLFYTLYCEDAFRENQFQYKAITASQH